VLSRCRTVTLIAARRKGTRAGTLLPSSRGSHRASLQASFTPTAKSPGQIRPEDWPPGQIGKTNSANECGQTNEVRLAFQPLAFAGPHSLAK
jgi:hypothetical protein